MRRWLLVASLALSACDGLPLFVPRLSPHPDVATLEPGQAYEVTLAQPVEAVPAGTTWRGSALEGSPFAFLGRRPLVLKADDFGGPLTEAGAWMIEAVDRVRGVVGLGIITSDVERFPEARTIYTPFGEQGFELWFHGHTHSLDSSGAEFRGPVLGSQVAEISAGLPIGRDLLGVDFRSFGAPGNGIDSDTSAALADFPQLVVWLFGPDGAPLFVLPHVVDIEPQVATVADPTDFLLRLDAVLRDHPDVPAITLQVHPQMWKPDDRQRFATVLSALASDDRLQLMTPYEVWTWRQDRDQILVTQLSPTSFLFDLTEATYSHRLAFPTASPATVVPMPPAE